MKRLIAVLVFTTVGLALSVNCLSSNIPLTSPTWDITKKAALNSGHTTSYKAIGSPYSEVNPSRGLTHRGRMNTGTQAFTAESARYLFRFNGKGVPPSVILPDKERSLYYLTQAAIIGDMLQTLSISKSVCYREGGVPTKYIIGMHPSSEEVGLLFMGNLIVSTIAHHLLDRVKSKPLRILLKVGYTVHAASYVVHNYRAGIGPAVFGGNDPGRNNNWCSWND